MHLCLRSAEPCYVAIESYSFTKEVDDPILCMQTGPQIGWMTLNAILVWNGTWCNGGTNNPRGVTIIDLDLVGCSAMAFHHFDTCGYEQAAINLAEYLQSMPIGSVLLGVTGDSASENLQPAVGTLAAAGVDVGDVQSRGSFAFAIQIGHNDKTVFTKSLNNIVPPARINFRVEGVVPVMLCLNWCVCGFRYCLVQ